MCGGRISGSSGASSSSSCSEGGSGTVIVRCRLVSMLRMLQIQQQRQEDLRCASAVALFIK
jgi:hypothetical protein